MNMRLFTVLSAVSVLALAACTTSTGEGTGGAGSGTGGSTSVTTGNTMTTTANGTGGSGGDGAGGAPECVLCGDAISDPVTPFCGGDTGPSAAKYDALVECTCTGNCMADCADNVCAGMDQTAECTACVQDTTANGGCGDELTECLNDT
jgi:hypothetical protein